MAIVIVELDSGDTTTDAASFTTASVDPADNTLVLVAVANTHATGATTCTLTGNGITYTSLGTNDGTTQRLTWFGGYSGASSSAGAITIDFGATTQTGCAWTVFQVSNMHPSAAVGSVVSGSGTGSSVTGSITYPNAGGAGIFAVTAAVNNSSTAKSGWTRGTDACNHGTPASFMAAIYKADTSDTAPGVTWTTSGAYITLAFPLLPPTALAGGNDDGVTSRRRRRTLRRRRS